jgi:hypothetical protein
MKTTSGPKSIAVSRTGCSVSTTKGAVSRARADALLTTAWTNLSCGRDATRADAPLLL